MKKLKVCLSMGGGVSLGAFSGAALTEALKLLVLFGRDKYGNKYDDVILDGMSGASAGSVSLAIMIRCLIDYKSIMYKDFFLNHIGTSKENVNSELEKRIEATYSQEALKEDVKSKMLALEVAQLMQELIWVKEIDTDKLFKEADFDPLKPFGLLNRTAIIALVRNYFLEGVENIDMSNRQLLGDRTLMAFSMANMSPMAYGEKGTNLNEPPSLVKTFQTATNINNHNELRVFNFLFEDITELRTDSRYITVTSNSDVNNIKNGKSLNSAETWSIITASAIASGAFPVGFAPVVLERYKHEYSKKEWKPKNEKIDKMNYAYIDGGTFNNEPIKEAFKMGYYNDFESVEDGDRLILFVDPSIPDEVKVQQLKSLDPLGDLEKSKLSSLMENKFKGEFGKAYAIVTDLVGMIHGQSKINEEAKVAKFYTSVLFKNTLINYLKSIRNFNLNALFNIDLIKSTYNALEETLEDRQISIGTRDVWELIWKKYKKLCLESNSETCLSESSFKDLYKLINLGNSQGEIDKLLSECSKEDKDKIAASFLITITESALNQSGKSELAERAGIFPVILSDVDNPRYRIEDLPGSEFSAFGGFASISAREACFMKARLDSIICLSENDFREYHYNTMLKQNLLNLKPYIDGKTVSKLLDSFKAKYAEKKSKHLLEYEKNILNNLRKPLIKRISSIGDNVINIFLYLKIFGSGIASIFNKNFAFSYILKESLFKDTISKAANIAIKFRYRITSDNAKLKINNKDISVEKGNGYYYFKLFLAQKEYILDINKTNIFDKCYLSTERLRPNNFDEVGRVHSIQIGKSTVFNIVDLNFLENDRDKLVFGINPVVEIEINDNVFTITKISELSKSLHEEINS